MKIVHICFWIKFKRCDSCFFLSCLCFRLINKSLKYTLKVIKFKSWHSRLAAIQMLQSFGIFNLFLVNDKIKSIIKEIIINSLTDEQLEVRLSACLTLTGFIHSNFFSVDDELIVINKCFILREALFLLKGGIQFVYSSTCKNILKIM